MKALITYTKTTHSSEIISGHLVNTSTISTGLTCTIEESELRNDITSEVFFRRLFHKQFVVVITDSSVTNYEINTITVIR